MTYYDDGKIVIRTMMEEDAAVIFAEEKAQGWHPNIETYESYFKEQSYHKRYVFIAEYEGKVAGYTTLLPNAEDGPFANQGIPEVVNFGVFIKYRNKGIGNKILDAAENVAAQLSDIVCLGVGVHSGYGSAQRI